MKLYGKNPVIERIKSAPKTINGLYLQKKTELSEVVKAAKEAGIRFESVDREWMEENCGKVHTQGVMADVPDFEYASFEVIVKKCRDREIVPVLLDGVTDPQNLGSIVRTLACLGGFAIVIPEYESAEINETVLRVASGGENYIQISRVKKLMHAVREFKDAGVRIAGAVASEGDNIVSADIEAPVAIIMGSEGKGIRPSLIKELDHKLSLPMDGAKLSYNVAIATALFCYEVRRMLVA